MKEQANTGAPALKEIFNRARLVDIARETAAVSARLRCRNIFMARATENLDALGIMQRMRQVAVALHAALPGDFAANIKALEALAPRLGHNFVAISLAGICGALRPRRVRSLHESVALFHAVRLGGVRNPTVPFA